jgi:hypothetical protein
MHPSLPFDNSFMFAIFIVLISVTVIYMESCSICSFQISFFYFVHGLSFLHAFYDLIAHLFLALIIFQ